MPTKQLSRSTRRLQELLLAIRYFAPGSLSAWSLDQVMEYLQVRANTGTEVKSSRHYGKHRRRYPETFKSEYARQCYELVVSDPCVANS